LKTVVHIDGEAAGCILGVAPNLVVDFEGCVLRVLGQLRCRRLRRRVVEKSMEELDLVLVGPKPLESPRRVGPVPGSSKLGFGSCGGK
jgi:hypothetical protein